MYQNTTMDATFEVLIPHSVVCDRAAPGCKKARVLQYGHGLFGDKNEVQTAYLSEDADRYARVSLGFPACFPRVFLVFSRISRPIVNPRGVSTGGPWRWRCDSLVWRQRYSQMHPRLRP